MLRRMLGIGLAAAVVCAMVVVTGCEDNDSDRPTGSSSIRGELTIDAFSTLPGVVPGILVRLRGPVNAETTSDENGVFEFSDLPAGEYVLYFYVDGEVLEYHVTVGEGQGVILRHIRFNEDGTITVFEDLGGGGSDDVDIAGDWTYVNEWDFVQPPANGMGQHLVLQQDGSHVFGMLGEFVTVNGSVDGHNVTLNFSVMITAIGNWTSVGTVNEAEDAMEGTSDDGVELTGNWWATRGWSGLQK